MNKATEFNLFYGSLAVGRIKKAFCSDETWHGVFEPQLQPTDGLLAKRVVGYITFTMEWNERVRNSTPAEPTEFDRFEDIVKSSLWATITTTGVKDAIVDAPIFFGGGDVTWRSC